MRKLFFLTLVIFLTPLTDVFGQNNELKSPGKEQMISMIDKIVFEIKKEKNTYRKIISETDNVVNSKNQPGNPNVCVFKKDKEIKIVQIINTFKKDTSDYYINNGNLIYSETKINDNSIDKTYYHLSLNYIIAKYKNEKEEKYTDEEKMKMGIEIQQETEKLIKRYKNK